jgi:hypothetical protein
MGFLPALKVSREVASFPGGLFELDPLFHFMYNEIMAG